MQEILNAPCRSYLPNSQSVEKALSLKCLEHKDEFCDQIHLKATSQSSRVCFLCMQERNIPMSEVTTVRQILNAASDSFVANYPLLEDSQISKKVKNIVGQLDTLGMQFESFYAQLQSSVCVAIELSKKKQKQSLTLISSAYSEVLQAYKEAGRIQEFQEKILSSQLDSENNLKQFLNIQSEKSSFNSAIINKCLGDFENLKNKFSTKQPLEISELLLKLIDQIDLFTEQNIDSFLSSFLNIQPQFQVPLIKEEEKQENYGINFENIFPSNQLDIQDAFAKKLQNLLKLENAFESNNKLNSYQQTTNQRSILSKIEISPSLKYRESAKQLTITRSSNGQIVIEPDISNDGSWTQCYMSQPLVFDKKYQIILEFNNAKIVPPYFCVGLIEACNKNDCALYSSLLHYYEKDGDNISKVLRGRKVHSGEGHQNIGKKQLELRIFLNEKLLRIANYPNYENVSEIDCPERIKQNEIYYLGFMVAWKQNSITIVDFLEVNNFDSQM